MFLEGWDVRDRPALVNNAVHLFKREHPLENCHPAKFFFGSEQGDRRAATAHPVGS